MNPLSKELLCEAALAEVTKISGDLTVIVADLVPRITRAVQSETDMKGILICHGYLKWRFS